MEAERCGAVDKDLLGEHCHLAALLHVWHGHINCGKFDSVRLQGPGGGPNDKGLSRKHIIEGTKVGASERARSKWHICELRVPHAHQQLIYAVYHCWH